MLDIDDFIVDLLVQQGLVDDGQLKEAKERAASEESSTLDALYNLKFVSEQDVMQLLGAEYGMDTYDFDHASAKVPTEVITLVGEGKPMNEIAAGIQMAVAKRCFVMAKKAGATDSITLTGGCAKNAGLKAAIEHVLKLKVVDLKTDPQLMGALGAAEFARQKGLAKKKS